jgi:hypothetical protein
MLFTFLLWAAQVPPLQQCLTYGGLNDWLQISSRKIIDMDHVQLNWNGVAQMVLLPLLIAQYAPHSSLNY